MSNEELALALTEIALKCGVFKIPSNTDELPYGNNEGNGNYNQKHIDVCMADITNIYRAALKAASEK